MWFCQMTMERFHMCSWLGMGMALSRYCWRRPQFGRRHGTDKIRAVASLRLSLCRCDAKSLLDRSHYGVCWRDGNGIQCIVRQSANATCSIKRYKAHAMYRCSVAHLSVSFKCLFRLHRAQNPTKCFTDEKGVLTARNLVIYLMIWLDCFSPRHEYSIITVPYRTLSNTLIGFIIAHRRSFWHDRSYLVK